MLYGMRLCMIYHMYHIVTYIEIVYAYRPFVLSCIISQILPALFTHVWSIVSSAPYWVCSLLSCVCVDLVSYCFLDSVIEFFWHFCSAEYFVWIVGLFACFADCDPAWWFGFFLLIWTLHSRPLTLHYKILKYYIVSCCIVLCFIVSFCIVSYHSGFGIVNSQILASWVVTFFYCIVSYCIVWFVLL